MGKDNRMVFYPMIFMFVVTVFALGLLIRTNIAAGNMLLVFFAVLLLGLSAVLALQSIKVFTGKHVVSDKVKKTA